MTLAQALYEFLTEQAAITAIVSDRIYPVELPQERNEVEPGSEKFDFQDSLVFTMASMAAEDGLVATGKSEEAWEIGCLSTSHAQAHELADVVLAALRNYTGPMPASGGVENASVQFLDGRDAYDQDFRVYGVVLTFAIST